MNVEKEIEVKKKLRDIFGEKSEKKKRERKKRWWKRFSDDMIEAEGSNDFIENLLLAQIPERQLLLTGLSEGEIHHNHKNESLVEEIHDNHVNVDTVNTVNDIGNIIHTEKSFIKSNTSNTHDVHFDANRAEIKHKTPPIPPKNVFNLSRTNILDAAPEPNEQLEDTRDDSEGVMAENTATASEIPVLPATPEPTLLYEAVKTVQLPENSLMFPKESEKGTIKQQKQQNKHNEQQNTTKKQKQQQDINNELFSSYKSLNEAKNRYTDENTDYRELGARPKTGKNLPRETVENQPYGDFLGRKSLLVINEKLEGGGTCPYLSLKM